MDDKEIIKLYFGRHEEAISETEKKYGRYCHYIARNILGNDEDSEECVNDTYLRAWESIPPACPENLAAYLGKITRNLAIGRYREKYSKKRGGGETAIALDELSECIADGSGDISDQVVLENALNRFLIKQSL